MIDVVIAKEILPISAAAGEAVKKPEAEVMPRATRASGANARQERSPADRKTIEDTVAKIREAIGPANSSLKIEIDPDTDGVIVKVLDDRSGEIIRQIPSQEMIEIAKRLDAMQGIFVTKRT